MSPGTTYVCRKHTYYDAKFINMDMSGNLQMSDLNFVKTLHGTGNIIKSLLLTKIVKLADYQRSKVRGVSMKTNPCKMKPYLL